MSGTSSAPDQARSPPPVVTPSSRLLVVDEKNMLRLWLEQKIARRELSDGQADDMLRDQEAEGKLWTGPAKDTLGSAQTVLQDRQGFRELAGCHRLFHQELRRS